jgi:hypothetical protein
MHDRNVPSAVQEHREAVRLAWKCCHIPLGPILITLFIVWSLLPTILTIGAYGPVNPVP